MNHTNAISTTEVFNFFQTTVEKRTTNQLEKCYDELIKLTFFSNLEQEMSKNQILLLIQELQIETYPSKYEIFSIGDFGKKFYIVLQGSVLILIPQDAKIKDNVNGLKFSQKLKNETLVNLKILKGQQEQKNLLQENLMDIKILLKQTKSFDNDTRTIQIENLFRDISQQYKGFTIHKELPKGESFGEIALRTEGLRTTTALCLNETILLVLNAVSYQKVLKGYHDIIYNEKIKFIRSIQLLKNWTLARVHQMLYYIKNFEGKKGEYVYKVNEPSKFLYFIKSGEVEIVYPVNISSPIQKKVSDIENQVNRLKRPINKIKIGRTIQQGVSLLGEADHFGEEEIFEKINRKSSAIVHSAYCEIYYISQKVIQINIEKFFNNLASFILIKDMQEAHQKKVAWHEQIIKLTNNIQSGDKQDQQQLQSFQDNDKYFKRRQQSQGIADLAENKKYDRFKKLKIYLSDEKPSKGSFAMSEKPSMLSIQGSFLQNDVQTLLSGPQRINLSNADLDTIKDVTKTNSQSLLNKRQLDTGFIKRACEQNYNNHPKFSQQQQLQSQSKSTSVPQVNLLKLIFKLNSLSMNQPQVPFLSLRREEKEKESEDKFLPIINQSQIPKIKLTKNSHFVIISKQGEQHRKRNMSEKILKSVQFAQ